MGLCWSQNTYRGQYLIRNDVCLYLTMIISCIRWILCLLNFLAASILWSYFTQRSFIVAADLTWRQIEHIQSTVFLPDCEGMQFVVRVDTEQLGDAGSSEQSPYNRSSSVSPLPLSSRSSLSVADSQIDDISTSFLPAQVEEEFYTQNRELICDDALIWLDTFANDSLPGCVFTSLPDISEVPEVAKGESVYGICAAFVS